MGWVIFENAIPFLGHTLDVPLGIVQFLIANE